MRFGIPNFTDIPEGSFAGTGTIIQLTYPVMHPWRLWAKGAHIPTADTYNNQQNSTQQDGNHICIIYYIRMMVESHESRFFINKKYIY